ncbi:ATP-binding protein [uncultured Sphaerochaeta sp.]|uniref:ATP-binding protein n=1 Tax=uncultured Sphaerochaeta sp. TaxID=886478 RepID=UPI0029CA13D2|nr:ATP-binding protein [uncultured Sphaerochaeta sp.]
MKTTKQNCTPPLDYLDVGVFSFTVPQQDRCILQAINSKACTLLGLKYPSPTIEHILEVLDLEPSLLHGRLHAQDEGASAFQVVTATGKRLQVTAHHQREGQSFTLLIAPACNSAVSGHPVGVYTHDLLFTLNTDYRILRVFSTKLEQYLKLPAERVIGQVFTDFFDQATAEDIRISLERARITLSKQIMFYHSPIDRDNRIFKATIHWVERNQRVLCYFAVDEVNHSTDSSVAILHEAPPGILILDRDGDILFADALSEKLLGVEAKTLVGTKLKTLIPVAGDTSSSTVSYVSPRGKRSGLHISSTPLLSQHDHTHVVLRIQERPHPCADDTNQFVNLLLNLTFTLLQTPVEQSEHVLLHILEKLGRWSGAERSYIFTFSPQKDFASNTHEWCAPGIAPQKDILQKVPCSKMPKWMETLQHGQEIYIRNVAALPDAWKGEREILLPQGITSLLIEPISASHQLIGFIGFDMVRDYKDWPEQVRGLLHFFAHVLGVFFARMQSERKLKQALQHSRDLADEKERTNRYMQNFYARISHDIHNSLLSIVEAGNQLEKSTLTGIQRSSLSTIHASSLFLTNLLHDILDYSSFSKEGYTIKRQLFSVWVVVENAKEALSVVAAEKEISITTSYEQAIPSNLIGDGVRLAQILINLLHNAVKYSEKGPVKVSVSLGELTVNQAVLRFSVHDHGKGMDEDTVQNLFSQGDKTPVPSKDGGYGLGLSIVKQLVDAMHGSIDDVQSKIGEGTTFTISLPFAITDTSSKPLKFKVQPNFPPVCYVGEVTGQITQFLSLLKAQRIQCYTSSAIPSDEGQILILHEQLLEKSLIQGYARVPKKWFLYGATFDRAVYQRYKDSLPIQGWLLEGQSVLTWYLEFLKKLSIRNLSPTYDFRGVRALVVDDAVINRAMMKQKLERWQVQVETAETGEEAIIRFKEAPFDVVFMDLSLSSLDGIETTKILMQQTASARIVAVSAYQGEEVRRRCKEAGITAFLRKPVQDADLADILGN